MGGAAEFQPSRSSTVCKRDSYASVDVAPRPRRCMGNGARSSVSAHSRTTSQAQARIHCLVRHTCTLCPEALKHIPPSHASVPQAWGGVRGQRGGRAGTKVVGGATYVNMPTRIHDETRRGRRVDELSLSSAPSSTTPPSPSSTSDSNKHPRGSRQSAHTDNHLVQVRHPES